MKQVPRRQSVQSIDIGLKILGTLTASGQPMQLKDIASACEMPPSQVHRYLRSFVNGEMVAQDLATGRYMLGAAAIRVGLAALQRLDGIEASASALRDLTQKWDYAGGIAVWGERGPVIVRWSQGATFLIPSAGPGTVFPLLGSAVGRVFLAFLPEYRTSHLLKLEQQHPVSRFAEARPDEVDAIRRNVREMGYSMIVDHFTPHIRGLAAPVLDLQGEPTAVITIAGRHADDPMNDLVLQELSQSAARVSAELGNIQAANQVGFP